MRPLGASEHVAYFESHAVTGPGRVRDEHVTGIQPFNVPLIDLTLAEAGFGGLYVVVEQMPGENLVSLGLKRGGESAEIRDRTAIASDGTRKINLQLRTRET
jgi:hypothetical protein